MTAKLQTGAQIGNATIAGLLRRYAAILSLEDGDRFRIKAYRKAAETLEGLQDSTADIVLSGGNLQQLPNIGQVISGTIEEIVRTGRMPQLEKAASRIAPALLELADWPALDPRKVKRVYKKLAIESIEELRARLLTGEIRRVFGPRMDFHIRTGLADRPRTLLWSALKVASKIEDQLKVIPGVLHTSMAGSLRRRQETVGNLNLVVAGRSARELFRHVERLSSVESVESRSRNVQRFGLSQGMSLELAFTSPDQWGIGLLLATGSQAHLDELRAHARRKGIDLTARGLETAGIDVSVEESVYGGLGLSFVEPELREGQGEVQAALGGRLPHLVTVADLKGDLHMHTTASDGVNSLEEMARAAMDRGYEYIAITDHSQSLRLTNGLSEARLLEQIDKIDRLNERLKGLVVLKSAEVDILQDGSLDYSDPVLKQLDLTICSIHSRFGLDKRQQTDRIRRAMDHPCFNILGHATGRLLLKREGYEFDVERIIEHARECGCFFEINSSPDRLDLSDEHARMAREAGVMIAINTDAHSDRELDLISSGINQARRGSLERRNVLNCLPLPELREKLRR